MKATDNLFDDFKKAANRLSNKKKQSPEYEIAFESEKDFNRFVRNIKLLMVILHKKPCSIYQLAKMCNRDLANVKKIIKFFEEIGAVQIKHDTKSGRSVKRPVVDYSRIEFNLEVA